MSESGIDLASELRSGLSQIRAVVEALDALSINRNYYAEDVVASLAQDLGNVVARLEEALSRLSRGGDS